MKSCWCTPSLLIPRAAAQPVIWSAERYVISYLLGKNRIFNTFTHSVLDTFLQRSVHEITFSKRIISLIRNYAVMKQRLSDVTVLKSATQRCSVLYNAIYCDKAVGQASSALPSVSIFFYILANKYLLKNIKYTDRRQCRIKNMMIIANYITKK